MVVARITSKGQVTVPKSIRDTLGLRTGDAIDFVEKDGIITVRKCAQREALHRYRGYLSHLAGRDVDELVEELRAE